MTRRVEERVQTSDRLADFHGGGIVVVVPLLLLIIVFEGHPEVGGVRLDI